MKCDVFSQLRCGRVMYIYVAIHMKMPIMNFLGPKCDQPQFFSNSPVISVSTDTSLKPTPRVVCCLTSPLLVDSQKDDVFKTLVKGKQTLVRSLSKRLRVHSSAALWLYFLLLFWPVVEHNEPGFSRCL